MGDTDAPWTDEAMIRESWRWTHVPPDGVLVEDDRRTLVHLPGPRRTSRVWRCRAASEEEAEDLIEETLSEVRDAGGERLIWHTGRPMSPPFLDDLLLKRGFGISQELKVLSFEMGGVLEPHLPLLGDTPDVDVRIARDAEDLREAIRVESEMFSPPTPSEQELSDFLEEIKRLGRRSRRKDAGDHEPLAFRVLASIGGEVVASAGAQISGETLRLWGAGTLRPYRGRGAYRALVAERCRVAHTVGATLALTKANAATSAPILETAGFNPVSHERRLVLDLTP